MKTHEENGHFGWDHTRLKLQDKWFWPGMDRDSKTAITECSRCRNFGPRHINSLLWPIKHREPFDLIWILRRLSVTPDGERRLQDDPVTHRYILKLHMGIQAKVHRHRKDNVERTHGLVSPLPVTRHIHDRWWAAL